MFLLFAQFLSWCCLLTHSSVRNLLPHYGSPSKSPLRDPSTVQCLCASIPIPQHPGPALSRPHTAALCCSEMPWSWSVPVNEVSVFCLLLLFPFPGSLHGCWGSSLFDCPLLPPRQNPPKSVQTSNIRSMSGSGWFEQSCESSSSCWRG